MGFAITELWNKEPFRLSDDVPAHELPSEEDDWGQLRASWWILLPVLVSSITATIGGLAVAAILYFTFVSAGVVVSLWVLEVAFFVSFVALLFVGAFYLSRITARLRRPLEQRERRSEWVSMVYRWEDIWGRLLGDQSSLPVLVGADPARRKPRDDTPQMISTLVFAKPAGFDSVQAVQFAPELCPAVFESLVYVAPGVAPMEDDYDTWSYFTLTHANAEFWEWARSRRNQWRDLDYAWQVSVDVPTAYLDITLDKQVRDFLLKRNLSIVMQELDMGIPVFPRTIVERSAADADELSTSPPYIMMNVLLRNGVTPQAVHRNQAELAARLHVGWLRFDFSSKSEIATLHACPTHPDKATFRGLLQKTMPKEIVRLDFEHWMRSLGLSSSDGWAGPQVARTTDGRSLRVTLPTGVTPNHVDRVLRQLEQDAGQRLAISDTARGSNRMTLDLLG